MNIDLFKQLYEKHFDPLRSYIYYRCGDEALASDIAQEAFIKLWEQRSGIEEKTVLQYLYTIARNLHLSHYRHDKIELEFRKREESRDKGNTENEYYYNELKQNYETILSQMPENQREVFLMSRMDGLKYKEIAERLVITQKAVEKRMNKAFAYLRTHLQPEK